MNLQTKYRQYNPVLYDPLTLRTSRSWVSFRTILELSNNCQSLPMPPFRVSGGSLRCRALAISIRLDRAGEGLARKQQTSRKGPGPDLRDGCVTICRGTSVASQLVDASLCDWSYLTSGNMYEVLWGEIYSYSLYGVSRNPFLVPKHFVSLLVHLLATVSEIQPAWYKVL